MFTALAELIPLVMIIFKIHICTIQLSPTMMWHKLLRFTQASKSMLNLSSQQMSADALVTQAAD